MIRDELEKMEAELKRLEKDNYELKKQHRLKETAKNMQPGLELGEIRRRIKDNEKQAEKIRKKRLENFLKRRR